MIIFIAKPIMRQLPEEELVKKLPKNQAMKEEFDYYYNQVWKGLSSLAASKDKIHDRKVNEIGRQRAKSGVYTSSKDGCHSFRVKGINGKY